MGISGVSSDPRSSETSGASCVKSSPTLSKCLLVFEIFSQLELLISTLQVSLFLFSLFYISLIENVDVTLGSQMIFIKISIYSFVTSFTPRFFLRKLYSIHNMTITNCVDLQILLQQLTNKYHFLFF